MTGGRLALAAALAVAAAAALGAAGEAEAHTNPGDEFYNSGQDPVDTDADHAGHLLLDTLTNGNEARFMWVNHMGFYQDWTIRDTMRVGHTHGGSYTLGWDQQSDGYVTIQRTNGNVINTEALVRDRSTYSVRLADGAEVQLETPFATTAATSGVEYHIPFIEILEATTDSVTFNATFKRPGPHNFGVSTTGDASDASTATTVTALTSAGPGDTQTGTITGLAGDTTYFIHGSDGDKAVTSDDSSRSVESFTTQAPPVPTPTASYRAAYSLDSPATIPQNSDDDPSQWIRSSIEVPASANATISKVTVFLDAVHSAENSIEADLTSPEGTTVKVTLNLGGNDPYSPMAFATDGSIAGRPLEVLIGESSAGSWDMAVYDRASEQGTFTGWWLEVEHEVPGVIAGEGNRLASITVSHDAADAVTIQTIGAYGKPYDVRVLAPDGTPVHEAAGLAEHDIVEAQIALDADGTYTVQTDASDADPQWVSGSAMTATFEHPHETHAASYPGNLDPVIDESGLSGSYYAVVGQEFAIDFDGADHDDAADQLYWVFDQQPGGGTGNRAALNQTDGRFTWTPRAADVGEDVGRVLLRDRDTSDEGEDSYRFLITVHEAVEVAAAPQAAAEGALLRYTVPLTNADSIDDIAWTITSGGMGDADIGRLTGEFTWTPDTGDARAEPYEFGLRAEVGSLDKPGNSFAEGTLSVTVGAGAPGAVTLAAADDPAGTAYETSVNIDVTGNDAIAPAGTDVTIAIAQQPASGSVAVHHNNDTVTYTPDDGYSGPDSFTYTISAGGVTSDPPATVTVAVAEEGAVPALPNGPPAIAAIGNQTATEGVPLQVAFTVTDPDGDALTVALDGLAALAGATFDAASRTLDWPAPAAGSYGLNLTAADAGATAYEFFWVNVGADNAPPEIAPVKRVWLFDLTEADGLAAGEPLKVDVNATDPDGDGLSYSIAWAGGPSGAAAPVGAEFVAATGVLEWTPAAGQAGVYDVTVTASDGDGSADVALVIVVAHLAGATSGLSMDVAAAADPPAPTAQPAPRAAGGGGSSRMGDGPQRDIYIRSISWDCSAGRVTVEAGPDIDNLAVSVRTTELGVHQAELERRGDGLLAFGSRMHPDETFISATAAHLYSGGTTFERESVAIDACTGEVVFAGAEQQAASQAAQQAQQQAAPPAPPGPGDAPGRDVPPPPPPAGGDGIGDGGAAGAPDAVEPRGAPADPEPEPAPTAAPAPGGGCLVATAAHGTEMAGQVQLLRQVRDGAIMQTGAGSAFMGAFSAAYYAFSPAVADLEREHPLFREAVRAALAPMLHSMSLMSYAEPGSEQSVLALGLSVIALNLGMYVAAPVAAGAVARRRLARRPRAA